MTGRPPRSTRFPYATLFVSKGVTLGRLGRSDDAVAVYDEMVGRYAGVDEPAVRAEVARALDIEGVHVCKLGRVEARMAAYAWNVGRYAGGDEPAGRAAVDRA